LTARNLESRYIHVLGYSTNAFEFKFPRSIDDDEEEEEEEEEEEAIGTLKATSHTRLRARDHYTSSTLIGGKGRGTPSSLHSTLEGLTKYVNARWM
jgi:hypothetical protein